MKRRMIGLLAACSLAAFVSSAVAQEAYSANAIGVIRKTLPAKAYSFISIPLNSSQNAEMLFSETCLMDLPSSSRVLVWNAVSNVWESHTKSAPARGGWGAFSNSVLQVGQPLFVYNYGTTPFSAVFSGEVPDESELSTPGIPGKGYQTVANPYPVPMVFGETDLATNAAASSRALTWDAEANTWISHTKAVPARGGWGSFATNVIQPGDGIFFYEYSANGRNWTVEKPYAWPAE